MSLVLFSALSFASASDDLDNTTVSVADNQNTIEMTDEYDALQAAPGTFTQLDGIIRGCGSGATLVLDRNYTYTSGDSIDGIVINKDLTIDGAGYTLNGANQASILKISGNSHVVLKNLNFINAYGTNGSAISLSASDSIDISNSKFINNVALTSGGAIYISSSSTITANSKITDSVFINNKATNGGAISARGTLIDIISSTFNNDTATNNGGSVFVDVGAYVDNCVFAQSSANIDGGAFYLYSIIADVSQLPADAVRKYGMFNTKFISCSAGYDGGAGYIHGSRGVVSNVTVIDCRAGNEGGAGYIYGNRGQLLNSTFINNTARQNGGAIVWSGINGIISGCQFVNNTATMGSGAALYQKPDDDVSVFDGISIINCSTFINNVARYHGGAVYVSGIFAVIHNSQFMQDRARDGAGIYLDVGASIEYCNFIGEKANNNGGAVYLSASIINTDGVEQRWIDLLRDNIGVRHSTVINCSAGYDGGACYVAGNNGIVTNVTLINNSAGHDGGAGYVAGSFGKLYNSTFINNRAARDGGALMWAGDGGYVCNVTCILNHADGGSGSICVKGSNITIVKSRFSLSNATLNGGAIYVYGSYVTISESIFDKCAATAYHGGSIFIDGRFTSIVGCNFTMNRVNVGVGHGGAINVNGNYTQILGCDFDRCTASAGGFVYVAGSHIRVTNSTGTHSFATNGGAFYVTGDYVNITNAACFNNNATQYAGAIYVAGDFVNLTNINLTRNIAYNRDGGAIYIAGQNTTIINANLVQNRVTGMTARGGAVYVEGDNTKILNSTFDRCTAYEGGVIYINGDYALIDGYSCIRSLALNDGGAIYVAGDYATIADFNITLTNATNYGGAIFIEGDHLNIYNSNFTKCAAYNHNGGAIYVLGYNTTISKSNFEMNKVNTENGCGGSITIHGDDTRIINSTFVRCTAYNGGVIYINGSNTLIDGYSCLMSFAANNGGAIFVEGNNASIADFSISLTNATNYGGAIYVSGNFTKINNSSFTRCIVDKYDGGALFIAGMNATVSNSVFVQNKVNTDSGMGGSLKIHGNNTNLLNCSFKMCTAYDGGVVYIDGSNTYIDGFASNMTSVANNGGALYIAGDNITVNNFNIGFANATNSGGAIYITGDENVDILNGNLTTAIAVEGDGGAVYVGGYNTTIDNCSFDKTRADNGYGGAVFIEGDLAIVQNSNFVRSFAYDGGIIYIKGHDASIINDNLTYSWAVDAGGSIYIEGDNVLVKDTRCAFTNASSADGDYAGWGGAIYIEGHDVNITSCEFFRNIVERGGSGGAIFILGENVNIEYSNFTYAAAPDYFERDGGASAAGAIAIGGDNARIYECNFQYSNARNGGVMFVEGSNTQIINSNITKSFADYDGGALYIFGEHTNISGTTFDHVMSERHGGAVYIRFGEYTNIENSNFTFCNSTFGGAIDIDGSDVRISTSNMIDCYGVEDGGAVYIAGNNVSMIDSNFTRCFVLNDNGGAVYWIGSIGLVNGSYFINNTSPRLGGAIFMKENSKITFDNTHFINNTAGINGGAIDFNRGAHDEIILNSVFENNMANRSAGAVFWFGTNGTIKNSNFTNNRALGIINYTDSYGNVTYGGYGGAVMWTGAQGTVDNCTFINNYAQYNEATKSGGRGGAVYLQGSDVGNGHDTAFLNSIFINNTAGYNGGAVDWFRGAANGRVENSTFINNTAHRSGGGIYWSGVNGTIKNSTFFNNSALGQLTDANGGGDGGAVLWVGPEGKIETVNFTNNRAAYSGGAIYLKGSDNGTEAHCSNVTVNNGIFEDNFAGLNGGAITFQRGAIDGRLTNSTFTNNTASRNGGALFWYGHNGTVIGCNFTENNALGIVDVDVRGVHQYVDENGNPVLGGSGGAVAWIGEVGHVNDSNFVNNTAARLGGAIFLRDNGYTTFIGDNFVDNFAGVNGGAVDFNRGAHHGTIINSTFENNIANRSGGAVLWFGRIGTITGSNFTNNKALGLVEYRDSYGNLTYGGYGGALMWTGSEGIVDNCRFEDNYAQYNEATKSGGRGGAVYLQGNDKGLCMNTTFSNSVFINNTAGYNGGAVDWFRGAANGRVENSTFINNTAHRSGGGIYWSGVNGTIKNSTFFNNSALGQLTDANGGGDGGAVLWVGPEGKIETVNFTNNRAAYSGGAIYLKGSDNGTEAHCSNVTVNNGIFEDNFAGLNGGAVTFQRGAMNGTISNSTFTNNTASRSGGALFWFGHNGTVDNCSFIENEALGLVDVDARGVHEYVDENGNPVLGGSGGAIAWVGEQGHVNDSDFINNTAARLGGAIFLRDNGYTTFDGDNFIDNFAGVNGGAIDFNRGAHHGTIINSSFENNVANRSGGAILWFGIIGTIKDSNFTNNTALGLVEYKDSYGNLTYGGYGGAIMWTGANGIVDNCQFDENSAARRGGAVYLQGSDMGNCTNTTFNKCKFTDNVAGTNGGAVDWHEGASDGHIFNSTFENNIANSNGGAVYWRGHNGTIVDSNFTNNSALGDHPGSYGNVGDGGAIYWAGLNGLVKNCRFTDNEAVNNSKYNASGRGGAVYIEPCAHGNRNTTFTNDYFENNVAGTNGGAINWHEDAIDGFVNNATFINNTAKRSGGAIFWNGYMGEIIYSKFYGNRALGIVNATSVRGDITSGGDGGAIMWSGADGIVSHCNFVNNTAAKRGGAVLLQGNEEHPCLNTVFTDDYFANNVAGTNGGAIDWYRGARDGLVDNSTFVNNTANRAAGAIYWSGVNGTVRNSKFIQNTALGNITDANGGGDGGAILWVGQNGHIEDSNFSDNYAAFSGGAIFLKGNDDTFSGHCDNVTVSNSIFANNVAGLNGGAVTFQRGARNGQLSNSEFINNTAFRNGGAVFWYGTNGTLDNCSFLENNALGLVDEDSRGFYQYFDSQGNQVLGGSGGAVAWTGDIGAITDSRFENNSAARYGGAIFLRDNVNTIYDGSSFINNKANHGGAIYWVSDSSVNLTNCILIGNIASKGSAIYLSHNMIEIVNSTFMDNRADAIELTLNVTRSDDNRSIDIIATFKGNDNLINAIWNDGQIALTNVTYLGVTGVANTGSERRIPVVLESDVKPGDYDNLYQTQYEDYQNITVYLYDVKNNLIATMSAHTNISGVAKFSYTNNENTVKLYELVFHPQDNYYTGIENSTSKGIVDIEIPAEDIYYLENESFVIKVADRNKTDIPTGNVTVLVNGEELNNFTLTDGSVEIKLDGLQAGTYNVTVKYTGDEKFFPKENSTTFKVMKIPSYIIPAVENYTHGESGKIIIQVPQNENNTVSVTINGKTYEVKVNESGYAEFDIPELDFGIYKVDFNYPETNNYLKSSNSTVFEIYPIVNVNVVKSVNVTRVYVNELVNFTITVSNDGEITSTNTVVSDKLPEGFAYVTSDSGSFEDGTVTWNIGDIASGSKVILWIVAVPTTNGTFANSATVNSTESGLNSSNEVNVTVDAIIDLTITKTVNATEAYVGDAIEFVITVLNNGPSNATDVKVTEVLSKHVKLMSAVTEYGSYDEETGTWNIGNLANGKDVTLTLIVKAISNGIVENTVSVTSDEKESNPSDNKYVCENVSVSKRDSPFKVEITDISYGEDGEITITLPEDATGTVDVTVNGKKYDNLPVENGQVKLTLTDLSGGNYDVNVAYSGDNEYESNSTSSKFNVAKITPTISLEVVDVLEGEIEVINVTVNAPGTVNITVNGITVEIPLDDGVKTTDVLAAANSYDGKASWKLINLAKGKYSVYAAYNANENYTSVNASDVFHVRGEIEDVKVNISDVSVGETARIEVKYPEDATGNVTITVDGKTYTKPLENGSAVFEVPNLKAGQHEVDVSYYGDDKYLPSDVNKSFEVSKVNPSINVNVPDVASGKNAKVTVTLPEDATGTVSVKINGKTYTASVKNGKATVTIPNLKAGNYDVDVSYSGDDKYNGTDAKKSFKVSKASPKMDIDIDEVREGETAKITVTLPEDATGTVTLEIGGKYYSAQVKDGKAVFNIPDLKAGDYNIAVHYSGDDQYLEEYAYDVVSVDFNENGNSDDTNDVKHESHEGLAKYPTANPIFVLMLAILAMGSTQIRGFKKE